MAAETTGGARRATHRLPFKLGLVLALLVAALLVTATALGFEPSGQLEIHYVNVQQGGATLVIGPDGTRVLMDAGGNGKGTSEVVPYLQSRGIQPADGLHYTLASHLDADHVGGFDDVLGAGYDVWTANYFNGSSKRNQTINDYLDAAAATTAGVAVPVPVGTEVDLGAGAVLTVVVVHGDVIAWGHVDGAEDDENDLSVGALIEYGDIDFLWAGDLGGGDDDTACTGRTTDQVNVETPLATTLAPGGAWTMLSAVGVDLLHVNHHGSDSSTNSDWMNLLAPEVTVIPVGSNGYLHPHPAVVDNVLLAGVWCIDAAPALVLQTEEGDADGGASTSGFAVGDVVVLTDGASYDVDATGAVTQGPDERAAAGLPLVAVPADERIFLDGFESGDLSAWG